MSLQIQLRYMGQIHVRITRAYNQHGICWIKLTYFSNRSVSEFDLS